MKQKWIQATVLLAFAILLTLYLTGCGSNLTDDQICMDLNFLSEATTWNDMTFSIKSFQSSSMEKTGDECIYYGTVVKENDMLQVVAESKISYQKTGDGWAIYNYYEMESQVKPLRAPDDITTINAISEEVHEIARGEVSRLNLDRSKLHVTIEAWNDNSDGSYSTSFSSFYDHKYFTYERTGSVTASYEDNGWSFSMLYDNNYRCGWNVQELIGTWRFDDSDYVWEFEIISFDGMTVTYRTRSAESVDQLGAFGPPVTMQTYLTEKSIYGLMSSERERSILVVGEQIVTTIPLTLERRMYVDLDSVYYYDPWGTYYGTLVST